MAKCLNHNLSPSYSHKHFKCKCQVCVYWKKESAPKDFMGKRVLWEKKEGKDNPSMVETRGFGYLAILEVGSPMIISGDCGIYTTRVEEVEVLDKGLKVKTQNSVYWVDKW